MTRSFEESWLSDDPLSQSIDEQLFGRAHLVERILDVLGRVREQSKSSTIGLVGAWGSGKSTVLDGVTSQLRVFDSVAKSQLNDERWLVAEFNPWMYSDPSALYEGFFAGLRNAMPNTEKWRDPRQTVVNLARKFSFVGAAAGFVGIDGEGMLNRAAEQLEASTVSKRDALASQLELSKTPILVVVDDLDRLTASELLQVFKLVRLVGRLPNVYYLLSYDEHTLVDLLSATDLVAADDRRRALDYLEKIVQIRLDMPLLRPFEIDRTIERAVTHVAKRHGLKMAPDEKTELINRFDGVMSKRLRTPRAIKRMFGQVDAFLSSLGGEVHFGDYLVVTWLRTLEPGVYRLLERHRSELLGLGDGILREMETPKLPIADKRLIWKGRLTAAHVSEADQEDVLYLLASLFTSMEAVYRSEEKPRNARRIASSGRIEHPDYFDRYFAFGVPADDVPDAVIARAMSDLQRSNDASDAVKRLENAFAESPDLCTRKLAEYTSNHRAGSMEILLWLRNRWKNLSPEGWLASRVEGIAATALENMGMATAIESILNIADEDILGLRFALGVHHNLVGNEHAAPVATHFELTEGVGAHLSKRCETTLSQMADTFASPFEMPTEIDEILGYWQIHGQEELRSFLSGIAAEKWDLREIVGWLVAPSITQSGVPAISEFTGTSHFHTLLDVAVVADALGTPATDLLDYRAFLGMPATPENRCAFAHAVVYEMAKQLPDTDSRSPRTR